MNLSELTLSLYRQWNNVSREWNDSRHYWRPAHSSLCFHFRRKTRVFTMNPCEWSGRPYPRFPVIVWDGPVWSPVLSRCPTNFLPVLRTEEGLLTDRKGLGAERYQTASP